MVLTLYNCRDADNVLHKTLTNALEKPIQLKDMADIDHFSVLLHNDDTIDFLLYNYAYVPAFQRYYFIERMTVVKGSLINVELKIDVLQSFQSDIERIVTDKVEVEYSYSPNRIDTADEKQTVLVTIGGN